MPPKRMTANPVRPARHRPNKPLVEEQSSSEEDDEEQEETISQQQQQQKPGRPPPKATSFPTGAARVVTDSLRNVDLNEQRRKAQAEEKKRRETERRERERLERDAGFVTESEDEDGADDGSRGSASDGEDGEESSEEEESEEDSDSSSDAKESFRPTFIKKHERKANSTAEELQVEEQKRHEEYERRQAAADSLVQERIEREMAAKAAGKKAWDDDDGAADATAVDDTDGLDPELERQEWQVRELKRLKRAREALEERERELAEIERRKNMTAEEREQEDAEHVAAQQEEKAGRNQMAYLQRYHHKGAFFQDDPKDAELFSRDLMGAQYQDQSNQRDALPQYLQVRDATKIGKKGQTRYRDLKSEDTGRWGDFGRENRRGPPGRTDAKDVGFIADERFRPDRSIGASGPTGANASFVGDRKRPLGEKSHDRDKRPRIDSRD